MQNLPISTPLPCLCLLPSPFSWLLLLYRCPVDPFPTPHFISSCPLLVILHHSNTCFLSSCIFFSLYLYVPFFFYILLSLPFANTSFLIIARPNTLRNQPASVQFLDPPPLWPVMPRSPNTDFSETEDAPHDRGFFTSRRLMITRWGDDYAGRSEASKWTRKI